MNIASQISIPNNTLTVSDLIDSFVDPDHNDEAAWTRINDRRVALIIKQSDEGLSPSECEMLDKLQAAMTRHNDVIAPLPWQLIEEIDARVRQIKDANE